jgi:hypothetical protein
MDKNEDVQRCTSKIAKYFRFDLLHRKGKGKGFFLIHNLYGYHARASAATAVLQHSRLLNGQQDSRARHH